MRIVEILSGKGTSVVTVPTTTSVRDVLSVLARHSVGAVVVSSNGRHIEGIVSERDIVRHLDDRGADVFDELVATIMSSPVHTCSADDSPETVMAMMTDHRVRHIPVVRLGELCGIVSIGDVVKSRIADLETDQRILVEYISAR